MLGGGGLNEIFLGKGGGGGDKKRSPSRFFGVKINIL